MSDKPKTANTNVIISMNRQRGKGKTPPKVNKVIPASQVNIDIKKVRIIGGDSDDFEQNVPPAIILEKVNDQISRIIVKCPCGRHAELICEYEEEEE